MSTASSELQRRVVALVGPAADDHIATLRSEAHAVEDTPRFRAQMARYAALGDPRRLAAVSLLKRRGELCACEFQAALDVSHATVSFHMDVLLGADIVVSERRGKWTYYRLSPRCDLKVP